MSVSIRCTNCAATLHPTGRSPRVRCSYCSTDIVLDPEIALELAQSVPVAPPDVIMRFNSALGPHLTDPVDFVRELAHRLERALPGQVEVEKSGGLFSKARVNKMAAQIGDWRYEAELVGAKLQAHRKHHVRGIALKSVALNITELISAIAGELHELSQQGPPNEASLSRFFG